VTAHRHGPGEPDCRAIFERLSEYLDEELPGEWCARVDAHLEDCGPCRAFLESLRRTVRWVQDSTAPPMPDDVRSAVREAFERFRSGTG